LIDIYGTQGTIHRDLKPENIIISPESVPFIIDFGIAKELLVEHTQKTSLILLSGNWSAPERRDGISGPFSDVYSLGKILFAMVMNIPNSKAEIFIQDKEEISAALGGKYPQVADLIIDSCNANYRDRIESIDEMLSVLEHLD
jgi:serine/threonine protein kinase